MSFSSIQKSEHIKNPKLLFRLLVRQSGKMLHVVPNLHFVDSPEWFGVAADEFFQVSKRAEKKININVKDLLCYKALCSRNFQNVKLRLGFFET